MMRILHAPWFAAVLGSLAYLATMAALFKLPPSEFARQPATRAVPSPSNDPSWKFRNPEFDQWVAELKSERDSLAEREARLKELQERLAAQRGELATATQTVAQLQAEFDRQVVRFKAQEDENLKREIKLFGLLSPETAMKMLATMTDEEVVRLMVKMKTEQVSQMLDTLSKAGKEESKRAATLMDKLRRSVPEPTGSKPSST